MRFLPVLLALLCRLAFADGGGLSCASDYTYDTVTTTIWRAKVKAVQRNGVRVFSGAYNGTYSISLLDSMRLGSSSTISGCYLSSGDPWKCMSLSGKAIRMYLSR